MMSVCSELIKPLATEHDQFFQIARTDVLIKYQQSIKYTHNAC